MKNACTQCGKDARFRIDDIFLCFECAKAKYGPATPSQEPGPPIKPYDPLSVPSTSCPMCGSVDTGEQDTELLEKALAMLKKARQAKQDHRAGPQCGMDGGDVCTACHYWSGAISTLAELLGHEPTID